ncbi:MAG TPA: galactokinase family protein [Clostridia bacterium]|nr:galactokinase family protein [Clostridia bacterium]
MARALNQEKFLNSSKFLDNIRALYSIDASICAERYSSLTEGLHGSVRFFSSPGRAELVGNHTDHNHGYVIASTIDKDVVCAAIPTSDNKITVNSVGYPSFTVDINDLQQNSLLYGTSTALVQGVVKGFCDRGYNVGGFICNSHSTIFKGAGVSSSAAFELLICEILNAFYNDNKIGYVEKALISQFAENVYFGKPSGLMDQLTISRGGVSFMDFENPNLPKVSTSNWQFNDLNMVIINCGGDHCNLTAEYSAIREEMHQVANYFGKNVLRDITKQEFFDDIRGITNAVSGRAVLRTIHFLLENERVLKAKNAVENCDKNTFLDIINASGDSSYKLLQNCYPANDVEQRVPLALALAKNHCDVLASRVHGGGFAGTILTFLDKKNCSKFENYIKDVFGDDNVFSVGIRNSGAIEVEI